MHMDNIKDFLFALSSTENSHGSPKEDEVCLSKEQMENFLKNGTTIRGIPLRDFIQVRKYKDSLDILKSVSGKYCMGKRIDEQAYQQFLALLKEIKSPLTETDTAYLVEYGQTNTPLLFEHYMFAQNVWDILNGQEIPLDRCIQGFEYYSYENIRSLLDAAIAEKDGEELG